MSNDYMLIQGWYDTQPGGAAFNMGIRDGLGNSFKISGKPNIKAPLILLGNTI